MQGVKARSILTARFPADDIRKYAPMPVDRKLLEILRCPVTKQQVFPLTKQQLTAINQAIAAGDLVLADGSTIDSPLEEGLVTENKTRVYRIQQDIPIMLEDASIFTDQVEGF